MEADTKNIYRYTTIVCIFLLYSIPFYQSNSAKKNWGAKISKSTMGAKSNSPFYKVSFVNQSKPNTMCHVSCITPIKANKIMCTWYVGSKEGAKDVIISYAFFEDGKWGQEHKLLDRKTCSQELQRYIRKLGNAVIFLDREKKLWLFYASVVIGGWSGSTINYKISKDEGKTWSKSKKFFLSPFCNLTNNIKNRPLLLDNGAFLLPVYREFANKTSQVLWVQSHGEDIYYKIREITGSQRSMQPCLLDAGKTKIKAFFRNRGSGALNYEQRFHAKNYILTAQSNDAGKTWSKASNTLLPNPNSGFEMLALDGVYLAVINNSFNARNNLTIMYSLDQGNKWKVLKVLENVPFANKDKIASKMLEKEFSYPSITQSYDGSIHITYTFEKQKIKHIWFNKAWLEQQIGKN